MELAVEDFVALQAEGHGAEAEAGNPKAGPAELDVFHGGEIRVSTGLTPAIAWPAPPVPLRPSSFLQLENSSQSP